MFLRFILVEFRLFTTNSIKYTNIAGFNCKNHSDKFDGKVVILGDYTFPVLEEDWRIGKGSSYKL